MRLIRFEFSEGQNGWTLPSLELNPGLNLLVGMSGVGKTRILKSLNTVARIGQGDLGGRLGPGGLVRAAASRRFADLWGVRWSLDFEIAGKGSYNWSAQFEDRPGGASGEIGDDPESASDGVHTGLRSKFLTEKLICDGKEIVRREAENIWLADDKIPKLSPHESVLSLLRQEDSLRDVAQSFTQVLLIDHASPSLPDVGTPASLLDPPGDADAYENLGKLRDSLMPTARKLILLQVFHPQLFSRLVSRFIDVFPNVDKVSYQQERTPSSNPFWILKIKEHGVSDWVPQSRISSGMYNTWMHLGRLALWPDGTVYMIDEFETSLGVNCIDFITEDVVDESHRMQFIITSHHPYIINNIDPKYWKIVSRRGSVVEVSEASSMGLDKSSHQAFIKLLNSDRYQNGIAAL